MCKFACLVVFSLFQDGIQLTYENMMDFRSFTVRVSEEDTEHLVAILEVSIG